MIQAIFFLWSFKGVILLELFYLLLVHHSICLVLCVCVCVCLCVCVCVCVSTHLYFCVFSNHQPGSLCSCLICCHETKATTLGRARRLKQFGTLDYKSCEMFRLSRGKLVKMSLLITTHTVLMWINCLFAYLYPGASSPKMIGLLSSFCFHIVSSLPFSSSSLDQLIFLLYIGVSIFTNYHISCPIISNTHPT